MQTSLVLSTAIITATVTATALHLGQLMLFLVMPNGDTCDFSFVFLSQ